MTKHAEYRLNSRVKPSHADVCAKLISAAHSHDSTALVAQVDAKTALIVIARGYVPVTVMYARVQQVNTAHLRVETIVRV